MRQNSNLPPVGITSIIVLKPSTSIHTWLDSLQVMHTNAEIQHYTLDFTTCGKLDLNQSSMVILGIGV